MGSARRLCLGCGHLELAHRRRACEALARTGVRVGVKRKENVRHVADETAERPDLPVKERPDATRRVWCRQPGVSRFFQRVFLQCGVRGRPRDPMKQPALGHALVVQVIHDHINPGVLERAKRARPAFDVVGAIVPHRL
jgi:hypothetical protein